MQNVGPQSGSRSNISRSIKTSVSSTQAITTLSQHPPIHPSLRIQHTALTSAIISISCHCMKTFVPSIHFYGGMHIYWIFFLLTGFPRVCLCALSRASGTIFFFFFLVRILSHVANSDGPLIVLYLPLS